MKMLPLYFFILLIFLGIIFVCGPRPILSAPLYWVGNPGGGGPWDTTTLNWWNGSKFSAWNNANIDDAMFQTNGGTISVNTPIVVHNITFGANNYYLNGNSFTLSGTTPTISTDPDITAMIYTTISGSNGLVKDGPGDLILYSYPGNDYTGVTKVAGGVLHLASDYALPGGIGSTGGASNLNIAGGVVSLDYYGYPYTFSRGLGTGPSQVQFTSSGGFYTNSTSWSINLGGTGAPLTWGSGGFVPDGKNLILGSDPYHSIDFQNPIYLGTASRTVQVPMGTAIISGSLVGGGSLIKTGTAILSLTNYNYYSDKTVVAEGILRLSHPYALPGGVDVTGGWDNLTFNGGVVELGTHSTSFQRRLGAGPGQVQFTGSGGFSAYGNDITINFGGASEIVTFNSGGFVPNGSALIFSSSTATGMVDFQNAINLGNALQTIQVANGSADVDAKFSNTLGGNGGLMKSGDGTLELTVANSYIGETRIAAGVLRLSHPNALPGGFGTTGGISNLNLNGGTLEWTGDLLRGLGTGPSQVQFTGSSILRPLGTSCIINFGGASQSVYWNSGGFIPYGDALHFDTTHTSIDFQNPINLNNSPVIIQVEGDSLQNTAKLSGTISGNGSLTKTGTGILEFTASNNYTGETKVPDGVLRLSHPYALPGGCGATGGTSNLNMNGGIVELAAGNFFRPLGTGPNQVQFHNGAFAAQGANRSINFGGASSQVIWGSANFLDTNGNLALNSSNSNATLDFQNPIDLGTMSRIVNVDNGSAVIDAKLSGNLSGIGASLEKTGEGVLVLSAANSYNGSTIISNGALRVSHDQAIPGGIGARGGTSNLVINYGVLELAAGNFYRSVGTGPDQVQFPINNGGFSAAGANRIVNLGGASAPFTLTSDFAYYPSLILSSPSADATLDFQNPIILETFWWFTPAVRTDNGSAVVDAKLSGGLSGTSDFLKSGEGTLELTAASTYNGKTMIQDGVLRISHPQAIPGGIGATGGTSNLILSGGVLDLAAGNFYRSLGTGPDQVQFYLGSPGGFSASGANRIVNFGGASAQIFWDYSTFSGNYDFILSSASADATLDLQNPINLASFSIHSVRVENGAAAVDAKFSGVLSGAGGIEKRGSGTLVFAAANSYAGQTTVYGGVLQFDAGIAPGGTQYIDVQSGKVIFNNVGIDNASLTINTAADAMFQIASGTHIVGVIQGDGTTEVDAGASLTAASIWQNTLTIAPGGIITIQPIPGGPLSGIVQPVPEPSIWILLLFALLGTLLIKRRR